MRWFLFSVLILSLFFTSPVFAQGTTSSSSSCSTTSSFSMQGIFCSLGFFIDQFTEFTPNILSSSSYGGSLAGVAYSQYVNGTEYAAEILIPLIIFIYVAHIIGESSFGTFSMSPMDLLKDIVFAIIALIVSLYVLSLLINFINVLDKFIVVNIIGSSSGNLFSTIVNDLGGVSFSNGFFSGIVNIVLYILLIIALFLFTFQFIVRFLFLWVLILLFPFSIVFSIYPPFRAILPSSFTKVFQLLFIQPAFLLGIAIFTTIMNTISLNAIEKLILGIMLLFSLSLVPQLVGGLLSHRIFSIGEKTRTSFLKFIGS